MKKATDRERALETIQRFSQATVLVVGDIMVDQFIWGKVSRISPEAPVPVVEVTKETLLFGGCANVMKNIFTIGGNVRISGMIGPDDMGRWFIGQCRKMGIKTEGIVVVHNRPTIVKTRVVAHHQQVVRFDREDRQPATMDHIATMLHYIDTIKDELGAIVISDYNKGIITKKLIRGIRNIIGGRDIVLCVDPKQDDFSFYQGCDVITPNHHEAGRSVGMVLTRHDDIIKAGDALLEKYGFKAVLITRGEEGMTLMEHRGVPVDIPTVAKEVFDVTGAGDTVIGVFALSVAAGASFRDAATIANRAAGIVVGKVGTASVTREELIHVI
jgi:D-beta-D-heptose 7-phosphate kinase/D-beta-D-heptose 1-phosphate adenosyltransferase